MGFGLNFDGSSKFFVRSDQIFSKGKYGYDIDVSDCIVCILWFLFFSFLLLLKENEICMNIRTFKG